MKVIISGCGGKMGTALFELINNDGTHEVVAGIDRVPPKYYPQPVYLSFEDCGVIADSIIDFSRPEVLPSMLKYAVKNKISVVAATTGLDSRDYKAMSEAAEFIPIFHSANMSVGMNLLKTLVKKAAQTLAPGFDIEIIEKHHNQKADAPSGSALILAEAVNSVLENKKEYIYGRKGVSSKRDYDEIGIHAVRGGSIVGDHEVYFIGEQEIIELSHRTLSRSVFAAGALRAAEFIKDKKPGLYGMDDLIGMML